VRQDQFDAKLEAMQASQDRKLDDKRTNQGPVINEIKGEMDNRMEI